MKSKYSFNISLTNSKKTFNVSLIKPFVFNACLKIFNTFDVIVHGFYDKLVIMFLIVVPEVRLILNTKILKKTYPVLYIPRIIFSATPILLGRISEPKFVIPKIDILTNHPYYTYIQERDPFDINDFSSWRMLNFQTTLGPSYLKEINYSRNINVYHPMITLKSMANRLAKIQERDKDGLTDYNIKYYDTWTILEFENENLWNNL